jgi:hypothetical protein
VWRSMATSAAVAQACWVLPLLSNMPCHWPKGTQVTHLLLGVTAPCMESSAAAKCNTWQQLSSICAADATGTCTCDGSCCTCCIGQTG